MCCHFQGRGLQETISLPGSPLPLCTSGMTVCTKYYVLTRCKSSWGGSPRKRLLRNTQSLALSNREISLLPILLCIRVSRYFIWNMIFLRHKKIKAPDTNIDMFLSSEHPTSTSALYSVISCTITGGLAPSSVGEVIWGISTYPYA